MKELSTTVTQQIHDTFKPVSGRLAQFMDAETIVKECNFAMQAFNKNSYLNGSSLASKQQAILNVAQIGLTLNPVLKLAYLVPRYSNGGVECFLEPSYQGIVKLITDTGSAKSVVSYPVYEGDTFRVELGTNISIVHNPAFQGNTKLTHVYAVATLNDGSKQIEVMNAEDINRIRESSESYKSFKDGKVKTCVWEMHYSEMARKTVIKRLCKYLPKTEMWDKLAQAIDLDNSDYPASEDQKDYIESLLRTSNIDHDERGRIERNIQSMSISEAATMIEYLQDNQLDPISAGHAYGQREIAAKTKAEIEAPKESSSDLFANQSENS